ncbi:MAG TPA: hypothetical protein VHL11_24825 [Phototrophicaceae bacterium]|jgi:hypothetical protein|nr:hypothetical protein [Phototrophicaceae bacterium]
MDTPLPSNEMLIEFSSAIPWHVIEEQKRRFYTAMKNLADSGHEGELPLEQLADAIGTPITTYYDQNPTGGANVLLAHYNGHQYILGSAVSARYRSGKTLAKSVTQYNMNPSVNHTNLHETDTPTTQMCALGAEVELGLLHPDGTPPTEDEMQVYIHTYEDNARKLGITPQIDREACQYQVEAHVAPGIGYQRTRASLDGILQSLLAASETTGLNTAIMAAYPIESDFKLTPDPKVETAVEVMTALNSRFPEYLERQEALRKRYQMSSDANVVQIFRLQGCHIHLDLAGRSEALGLLGFYTVLRSATAIANSAFLKGSPFVNGVCDAELLCTREYLRSATVTGRYMEIPITPHLSVDGLEHYSDLLRSEKVNAMARALLGENKLGEWVSAMHNPIGRIRPDLGSSKRICTLESTGMPVNVSASRQAAVLTDFEFTHALIEEYFRKYGCDLEPMYNNQEMLAIMGPLTPAEFQRQQDESDRVCTDLTITTAAGTTMSLAEFYELKRRYMHKHLPDLAHIRPKDIDEVYGSISRMLVPPSGQHAETVEQYISDPKLRSTGNWGCILRDAFIEEGGVPGTQNSAAVLRVTNRVHEALKVRYLQN